MAARTGNTGAAAPAKKEFVTIKIPRAVNGESNSISASLNGKVYLIKRGVPVQVPRELAEIIAESEAAQEAALEYIEKKREG